MRPVGKFAEFEPGDSNAPSITVAVDAEMPSRMRRLVGFYLVQAGILRYTMEILPDVLDGEQVFLSGGLRTDGEWYWRADLAHYVLKYGLALPGDFLKNAEVNKWTPPELSEAERGRLARLLREEGG